VYRLALRLVRDRPTAEDVTQEAFIHAYRSLPRFRGTSKFSTWMFRITRNCAVDAIRRRERQRRRDRAAAPEPEPVRDPSLRTAIDQAVEGLPSDLREAFVLIEVLGLSYRETAVVLGVLAGTLKSRMHRARRLLVTALEEADADEV
jgi:RNA polymerase sigma-70 factor, ECF subfamily